MGESDWAGACVRALREDTWMRRATAYLSPRLVVKATRQRPYDRRYGGETFVVTIGAPNYRERAWIKLAKAGREPFPVWRILLTAWPKRRARG